MCLQAVANGVLLQVRAHPGARKNAFTGYHDGRVKVETTAAPEKGKANQAIAKFLAKSFGVPAAAIHLQTGETAREKTFLVVGATVEALREKLPPA